MDFHSWNTDVYLLCEYYDMLGAWFALFGQLKAVNIYTKVLGYGLDVLDMFWRWLEALAQPTIVGETLHNLAYRGGV